MTTPAPPVAQSNAAITGVSGASAQSAALEEGTGQPHTLLDLLSAQARRSPAATAVICGDRSASYAEIEAASDRLAQRLLQDGLAPRTRIAVLLDRSVDVVVALIGVLKAGSAYIPLDPSYPPQRLSYVLDNARPAAVISRSALMGEGRPVSADDLIEVHGESPRDAMPTLLLDVESRATETGRINLATPEDVAYVIYTSGSTGVPKGVQIGHRALFNFIQSMRIRPGLSAGDTLVAVTTVAFDIAVLEIFLPLVVGATVVLARESEVADGVSLRQLLESHAATVMQATPVTWRMLIDAGWQSSHLKMLCGGEALTRRLADELLARGGELWNLYGPTETTVWSAALQIAAGSGPILLGPPIHNTAFYVLNPNLQPVADGETGELYIGGDGVAIGYVDLPAQTAERFLTDPFAPASGARMYRTGDLVRRAHNGDCLEFLGRADQQVKIRGHRIELGEIEATLLRHPEVTQAVATVRDEEGEPSIHAYVVLRRGDASIPADLAGELRLSCVRLLPSYMHPVSISGLLQLPQTPNGKVDRRALPPPSSHTVEPVASPSSRMLQGNVEQKLAALWGALLGIRPIDASANFFALGGRSLLAAQLLTRIEGEFGVRLTLPTLFKAPTIAAQAAVLQQWTGRLYEFQQIVQLHAGGTRPPLIAIHNTGIYCYHLAQLLGSDQPLTALQLFDPSRKDLPPSLEDIASEYAQLIRKFQPLGPYQLIGWCVGGVLAFETARQLREQGCEVSFVGLIDAWAPGHLRRMSRVRAWMADRSYRTQLVLKDWSKVRAGEQGFRDFLRHRVLVQRLLRAVSEPPTLKKLFSDRHLSGEHYDRWLAAYLEAAADRYEPKPFDGKVLLLRSSREPRGWLLDRDMGWQGFVVSIESAQLEGDHFTVFRGEGLKQLAKVLADSLARRMQSPVQRQT
jgi:amino acid adenylation domain-containing protein